MNLLNKSQLLSLWEQSYALSYKIDELLNKTYSVEHVKDIIFEIKCINDKFMSEFLSENYFSSMPSFAVWNYSVLFKNFYERVGAISNCNTSLNPYEVMIPVKEILEKLCCKDFLLTEPTWEINYAIGSLFSENTKQYFRNYGFNVTDNLSIIRIQFPTIHQDNVLLGAIMGHELGHYLDLQYKLNITENVLGIIINKFELTSLYKFINIESTSVDNNIKNDILRGILPEVVLKSWISELVADIIGIILYGVASHFSCEQIFFYYGFSTEKSELLDKYSLSHPRHYLRSIIRIETMSILGYASYINRDIFNYIEAFHKGWQNSKVDQFRKRNYISSYGSTRVSFSISNESLQEIENVIIKNYKEIVKIVVDDMKNFNKELFYDPKNIKEIVEPLVEKIEKLIPPNELNRNPVDSISIINAGWFAYLLKKDTIRYRTNIRESNNNDKENRDLINNLIKKAIVASSVHRRWINASNN